MRTRIGLLTAVAAMLLLPGVAAADGEGGAGTDAGAYLDPEGNPTVEVVDTGSEQGGGSNGESNCFFRVAIEDDFVMGIYDESGDRMYSESGRWLELVCDGSITPINGQGIVPEGGAVDPRQLAEDARESVQIAQPPIETSPDADRETYAQVTTWLWVDNDWWQTYSATATAGRVSATVTASPNTSVWATGDGGTEHCAGPGVEWHRGMDDDDTYCSHVYTRSSDSEPDGTYLLEATVSFDVTWTSNVGLSGSLQGVSRTSSRSIRVGEIQAVETE